MRTNKLTDGKWTTIYYLIKQITTTAKKEASVESLTAIHKMGADAETLAKKFCNHPGREAAFGNTIAYTLKRQIIDSTIDAELMDPAEVQQKLDKVSASASTLEQILLREAAIKLRQRPKRAKKRVRFTPDASQVLAFFKELEKIYKKYNS